MVPNEMVLISDKHIVDIPVKDNQEKMVDLIEAYPEILVDISRKGVQKISESISKIRYSAAEKLSIAQGLLPEGIKLKIKECYRPLSVQQQIFQEYLNRLSKIHSNWDKNQLNLEAAKFVAPPEIAPHSTGGAVDLTLVNLDNEELDMGTMVNANPEEYGEVVCTLNKNISDDTRAHRQILIEVMSKASFVNYPFEWWHWSYGDKYWAYWMKQKFAIFGSI